MSGKKQQPGLKTEVIASYNQLYGNVGKLRDSDAFYHWVLKKLTPNSGSTLLDVACGEGHLLRSISKYRLKAIGIDFSKQALQTAQQIISQQTLVLTDGEELPFKDQSMDYVTNLGSLEHFASPERGLLEMQRVLKPGGQAALVLPNSYYWVDILWHVWRRGYPVSHSQAIERFATFGEWRDVIENHGFQITKAYKYNLCFPRSFNDIKWYGRFPKKLIYVILSPITPFNLSYSFLFICRRHE